MKRIYGLIRKLGATSKYKGYFFVAEAVKISMRHQYKPMHITKDIYPCLATKYKSTPTNIEHDIRTLINVCWEGNKSFLDEIAGYPLEYKPTNSLISFHREWVRPCSVSLFRLSVSKKSL